ncbi:hypothetical protein FJT64_012961 [Amphibalanus amphitrite]|uniref:Uncharacterized protein n=1 Tax=Amphibalanus amphitrite TaxID=1232801 RepID=A0A6A4V664_AMPAM|nr:hypothetical protein FJT64_012961 [Amphibalanus amphitrite]
MYDSVHLYKNFFFNLMNKKTLVCTLPGLETTVQAQFKHLQQLHKLEMGEEVKMAFKLTGGCYHGGGTEQRQQDDAEVAETLAEYVASAEHEPLSEGAEH